MFTTVYWPQLYRQYTIKFRSRRKSAINKSGGVNKAAVTSVAARLYSSHCSQVYPWQRRRFQGSIRGPAQTSGYNYNAFDNEDNLFPNFDCNEANNHILFINIKITKITVIELINFRIFKLKLTFILDY